MKHLVACVALLALVLAGCATGSAATISANPQQTLTNAILPPGGVIVVGLQNAAYNLDQAVAIKVLAANDPADLCVHQFLQGIGQDVGQAPVPPAPSFTPKVSDLISGGSVAYILAQQAKALAANGGIVVPPSCEQLIGHMVLTGVNAPANATISALGRLIP